MAYDNLQQVINGFEEKAKQLKYDAQAWIFKAKRNLDSELLTKLDRIVVRMPDTEKRKLIKRFTDIVPDNANAYGREYDDQFLEAMLEMLGWDWLQNKYTSCEVQFMVTPDIVVREKAGNLRAAMECKKIRSSDEDRNYFKYHQGQVRQVKTNITSLDSSENPFLRKICDTLSKAEAQLNKVEAPDKLIFIDFAWDISAVIQKAAVINLVQRLAAELQNRSIKLIGFENYRADKPFVDP